MIFLDTTVLIDYFNGISTWQTEKLETMLGHELIVIGDYVLTEILQGFSKDLEFEKALNVLNDFPCYNLCGKDIAIKSAKNFRYLRKKGVTIRKTIDSIIATFCIEHGLKLLHNDRDFEPYVKYLGLITVEQ